MPIVDGLTATKMIRSFEHSRTESHLSPRAAANGRVPIFAVSASLLERERQIYIDAGFDGWVLKPIDFKRLNTLLTGIVDESTRNSCLYTPGDWEAGGWFRSRQQAVYDASMMTPSKRPTAQNRARSQSVQADWNPQGQGGSDSGSVTPTPSSNSDKRLKAVPPMSLAGGDEETDEPTDEPTDDEKEAPVVPPPPIEGLEEDALKTPQQT